MLGIATKSFFGTFIQFFQEMGYWFCIGIERDIVPFMFGRGLWFWFDLFPSKYNQSVFMSLFLFGALMVLNVWSASFRKWAWM